MTKQQRWYIAAPLLVAVALTLVYFVVLVLRPSEAWFGVPGEWTWSGRPPSKATLGRWWPAVVLLGATFAGAVALDGLWMRMMGLQRTLAIVGLIVMVPMLQVAMKYIHYPYPVEFYLYRTIGPHNGFWQAAISIEDLGHYLSTFPEQMRAAAMEFGHLTTHPPGAILYIYGWRRLFEGMPVTAQSVAHWLRGYNCADFGFVTLEDAQIAAALGQMIVPLWSGLTLFPLYRWARRLGGPRTAWRTVSIYALVPALSLFTMRWDTLYPLFAATAFAALHQGLDEERPVWWYLSGLTVSIASYFSFGNAPLAPALALYAVAYLWLKEPKSIVRAWRGWLALITGGYTVWALNRLFTGVSVWELLAVTGSVQAHLRESYAYGLWLFYNIYDILIFVGLAVSVIFVLEAVRAWRRVPVRDATSRAVPPLVAAAIILVVDVAGVSPGEVGRLWMYWAVAMTVTAALRLHRLASRPSRRGYRVVLALLALQSLAMTLFLRVTPTGMASYTPRRPSPTAGVPPDVTTVERQIVFGGLIELVGYDVTLIEDGSGTERSADVTLFWRALERPDLQYTVFVHAIDGNGDLLTQHDSMPVEDTLPTSCWMPGELIEDKHHLTLPTETDRLRVGLYYWPTMDRLSVTGSDGDSAVLLPLSTTQSQE